MTPVEPRRIVVGVDGSANSRLALHRAADEAAAHDASLEIVLAWGLLDEVTASRFDPQYGEETARADLQRIVAEELGEEQAAVITLRIENDLPARAILATAEGAWMIVLGSRGLGGFKGLLLGSVSQQVAHHSPCPLLIVPAPDRP